MTDVAATRLPSRFVKSGAQTISLERDASALGGVADNETGVAGHRICDGVADLSFARSGQREFRVADAEGGVADQHLLILHGRAALIFDLGAETVDLGDREIEFLVVRIGPAPGALIALGIDGGVGLVGGWTQW